MTIISMDQDLVKILESAGFTEKEAEVYLALLELGKANVTEIAKASGLKRGIIYVILEGLMKRGYASELPERKINTYQAMDPSAIVNNLRLSWRNFSEMLPIFRSLGNSGKKRPRISYHETKEGILNAWEEMNHPGSNAFFISSYERIEKHFPGAIADWVDRARKGILKAKCRHLIADMPYERQLAQEFLSINQEVRVMPELQGILMDFTIYDNKLAITSLGEEPFIVVIESAELVASMQPLFELAWRAGKRVSRIQKIQKHKK